MGDNRYVPWFNAPPRTEQEMGVFLMISNSSGKEILNQAAQLTRGDQFAKLPNHVVFASHFHVEHALDFLKKPKTSATKTSFIAQRNNQRFGSKL